MVFRSIVNNCPFNWKVKYIKAYKMMEVKLEAKQKLIEVEIGQRMNKEICSCLSN